MTLLSEADLDAQYRQFLARVPRRQAVLAADQHWSWIDAGGGDQALLMLPGFMGEAETSFLFINALAEHARVISVSHPPSVRKVAQFCDGLCALMDQAGIPQAVVLGGSSGGFLAQAFARHAPARTGGLILTHTGLPSRARARSAQRYHRLLQALPFTITHRLMLLSVAFYFPGRSRTQAFWRDHFRSIIRGLSHAAVLNRFSLLVDFHQNYRFHTGDLALEPGRILLMEMLKDHLSSAAEQAQLRALYPAAVLHSFSETAHYDSVERPDEQIGVIARFLRAGQR